MATYQEEVTLNPYRAELSVMLAGIMDLLAIGVYQNNSGGQAYIGCSGDSAISVYKQQQKIHVTPCPNADLKLEIQRVKYILEKIGRIIIYSILFNGQKYDQLPWK